MELPTLVALWLIHSLPLWRLYVRSVVHQQFPRRRVYTSCFLNLCCYFSCCCIMKHRPDLCSVHPPELFGMARSLFGPASPARLVPNSTTQTPATDMLYNTTNGQAHNNSTTCCTTNLPHRNARAQHLDMSRHFGMWQISVRWWRICCTTSCRIVVSLSVGGVVQHVRSRCPCSGVWHLISRAGPAAEFFKIQLTVGLYSLCIFTILPSTPF